jgi:hypothetical protein
MSSIHDQGFVTLSKVVVTPVTSTAEAAHLNQKAIAQFAQVVADQTIWYRVIDGMHRVEAYHRLYQQKDPQAKR